ncbi:MAG: acylphosphatase [Anaerolineales bacterium]
MQPQNPNENRRVHVWVKGRVQGVGFRAHVEYFAAQCGVSGWARNVGADTVEAVAEGTPAQLALLLDAVKRGPRMARVDEFRVEEEPATGEFTGFSVRRSV